MRIDFHVEESAADAMEAREAEALLVRLEPAPGVAFSSRLNGQGVQVLNSATDAVLVVVEGDEALRRQVRDEIGNWPEVRQVSSLTGPVI